MAEVDHVIGNDEKMRPQPSRRWRPAQASACIVNDIMSVRETAHHLVTGFGSRARAYVQIQNGCDHRCTFCIIPYGRGNSRSVPAGVVVDQIRTLAERGYREVVLTGVDITAYGADLPGDMTLGRLVRKILKLVPELPRLRLSSIDTIEADEPLMPALAEEERLMPHLHLSLQAGDDMILKRMKRRHSRAHAIAFCDEARRLRPDIVFGADIIAGFPTETEAMFANSMRMVEECGLTFLHVFPFSPRPGTPAARMPQLDRGRLKSAPNGCACSASGSRCLSCILSWTAHRGADGKGQCSGGRRISPSWRSMRRQRPAACCRQRLPDMSGASHGNRALVTETEPKKADHFRPPVRERIEAPGGEQPRRRSRKIGHRARPAHAAGHRTADAAAGTIRRTAEPAAKTNWFQRLRIGPVEDLEQAHRRHHRRLHQAQARCCDA